MIVAPFELASDRARHRLQRSGRSEPAPRNRELLRESEGSQPNRWASLDPVEVVPHHAPARHTSVETEPDEEQSGDRNRETEDGPGSGGEPTKYQDSRAQCEPAHSCNETAAGLT